MLSHSDPIIDPTLLVPEFDMSVSIQAWERMRPVIPAPPRLRDHVDIKTVEARCIYFLNPDRETFNHKLDLVRSFQSAFLAINPAVPCLRRTGDLPWHIHGPHGVWYMYNVGAEITDLFPPFKGLGEYRVAYLGVAWFTLREGEMHVALSAGTMTSSNPSNDSKLVLDKRAAWRWLYPQRAERLEKLLQKRHERR